MNEHQRGFVCCVERHLVSSGLALAIYGKLYQVCYGNKGKGIYYTTLEPLADFFQKPYKSISRAVHVLRRLGFLELVGPTATNGWQERTSRFGTKSYKVVKHVEWAEKHPGKCYEAPAMPWDSHGDPLARRMHTASEGQTLWYANMLVGLRKTGLTDDEIVVCWETFIAELGKKPFYPLQWRSARGKFLKQMKELALLKAQ
jgi:hypothetical protein